MAGQLIKKRGYPAGRWPVNCFEVGRPVGECGAVGGVWAEISVWVESLAVDFTSDIRHLDRLRPGRLFVRCSTERNR